MSIKNIPTGPGDTINVDVSYANGASRYVIGGVSPNSFAMYGNTGVGVESTRASGSGLLPTVSSDPVVRSRRRTLGACVVLIPTTGVPLGRRRVFGAYAALRYNGTGKAVYCAGMGAAIAGQGVTSTCNPDFNIAQVGFITRWTPVKNLTFSGEVMWTALDQKMSGVTGAAVTPACDQADRVLRVQGPEHGYLQRSCPARLLI